jgi:hypothetical protein
MLRYGSGSLLTGLRRYAAATTAAGPRCLQCPLSAAPSCREYWWVAPDCRGAVVSGGASMVVVVPRRGDIGVSVLGGGVYRGAGYPCGPAGGGVVVSPWPCCAADCSAAVRPWRCCGAGGRGGVGGRVSPWPWRCWRAGAAAAVAVQEGGAAVPPWPCRKAAHGLRGRVGQMRRRRRGC